MTNDQLRAVQARDRGRFVYAAAGSGKTTVMVERFVRAVTDDGAAVDQILAITFTEKAAAELKMRLRTRFLQLSQRERAREIERSWVSTIHGFCSSLLRAHALRAGLDPAYRVLDEAQVRTLRSQATERALEDFARVDPNPRRIRLLATYTPQRLAAMVSDLYDTLRSRGQTQPELPALDQCSIDDADVRVAAVAALDRLEPVAGANRSVDRALARLRCIASLFDDLADGEPCDPSELERLQLPKSNARALQTPELKRFRASYEAYLSACQLWHDTSDYELIRDLFSRYSRCYRDLKLEGSWVDFSDLELGARDLLRTDAELRERYRSAFRHIMVDEFQDTNNLQTEILDLIEATNVFYVGDEFQSIYRFRNANVDLFRKLRDRLEADGAALSLAHNFRSSPEILAALNCAFESVFGPRFQTLKACAPLDSDAPPSVELITVDQDTGRWESELGAERPFGASMQSAPVWRAAEARLLALRIEELTQSGGFSVGDVCVLLRTRTDIGLYERALADRQIPSYVAGGLGYWSQLQVTDLRAYLATLCNPLDEIALYQLLACPLVGVSLDGLCVIAQRSQVLGRDVWQILEQEFSHPEQGSLLLADELDETDRRALGEFVSWFVAERGEMQWLSLETLIERVVETTGYDRSVLALSGGERRMANVRKLMRLARTFEQSQGTSLREFVDFMDEQGGLRAREGEAPTETEAFDAVRLMTIHAAKGLEFPVVCVADLGREPVADSPELALAQDGRIGLRARSVAGSARDGLSLESIKADLANEQEQEERRIFYVAMTRAKQRLILSGATDTDSWPEPKPLRAPINWIWRAFAPDMNRHFDQAGRAQIKRDRNEGSLHVACTLLSAATVDQLLPASDRVCHPRRQTQSSVTKRSAPPPPAPAMVEQPSWISRLSYSALARYADCGYRFYLESVLGQARERSGALQPGDPGADRAQVRGSVVHELLEGLDFAQPALPQREQVAALFAAHAQTQSEADIDRIYSQLGRFMSSPLCARLAAAQRVDTELAFSFVLDPFGDQRGDREGVLINGVVDVYACEPDRILVVDYKTDELRGRDPARLAHERYATQAAVYALAALRGGAAEVEVCYCFLEAPEACESRRFAHADVAALEGELSRLVRGVCGGWFEPANDPHADLCAGCPGQGALCSWPLERTLQARRG